MCQPLGRPQPPGQLRRLQAALLGLAVPARPGQSGAPAQQQLAADRLVGVEAQGRQRPPVLGGRLLVGVQAHGPLAGPAGVGQRLGGLAGRRDLGEVVGELGDMGTQASAVLALDRLPDPPVQVGPDRDRQPLVEHLPDQGMGEAVAAGGAFLLQHHLQLDGFREPTQDAADRDLAGGPQQRQVERLAHDRGRRQHQDGVGGQRGQPPPDHRPDAPGQGHAQPARVLKGDVGGQEADGLADEQRVALGRLVDGGHHRLGGLHPGEGPDEPPPTSRRSRPRG